MLPGRKPTEDEARYLDDVASLGCIICLLYLNIKDSPAEIHHVEGKTKQGCHFKIIPLCAPHHRIPANALDGYVSRANGKKAFEQAYMPEEDLILLTQEAVKLKRENTIGRKT
jgi:hypothetical protein